MIKYDAAILQQFADSLYAKARNIVVTYAALGLVVGGLAGLFLGSMFKPSRDLAILGNVAKWGPALLGLAWGIAYGQMKSFMLRLEAQKTLCQLQIESNTRSTHAASLTYRPDNKQLQSEAPEA